MFKRVTLVRKRPELTSRQFADIWRGEHVEHARRLPGLREYVIDFVTDPDPDGPDGIATVRFDTREACEAAFATPGLSADLSRTREDFASSAQVLYVEERVVHRDEEGPR